jgi:23S rRNA (cytidine1920-2'-O)/16S rRNA (cytidine1409-2'-O)-methyltransferase
LLGSLHQDPRVVALERTNLGSLTPRLVRDLVEVVTMDLSYLPVARAAPQLEAVRLSAAADLVALVKPQHELGLGAPPDEQAVAEAVEWLVHARR